MEKGRTGFSVLQNIAPEPDNLVKGLQLLQKTFGYLSDSAIDEASRYFHRPAVEVEKLVSFYACFKRTKPGKCRIAVCDGTACRGKGAGLLREWLNEELHLMPGETTADGMFSLETVTCMGCCSDAPVMSVNGRMYVGLNRKSLVRLLKEYADKTGLSNLEKRQSRSFQNDEVFRSSEDGR